MKNEKLVLAIDVGTQSVRTALINKLGEIVAIVKSPYEKLYYSSENGYAEQNPDYYFDKIISSLKKLCEDNGEHINNIIGSTITTFRDSSVQLDENNKPVRDCILWLDQRMAKCSNPLPFSQRFIFALVGMKDAVLLNRQRTIANWLIENELENWKKTKKYVNISTYLTFKLTGNLIDSCSSMTGHYPMNFKKKEWYKDNALKGYFYSIPTIMRPKLVNPGEELGIIKNEICEITGLKKGIKLIATGSDKACETIGLGALNRDTAAISYGTACTIEVSNKHYYEPEKFLPAYPAATKGYYNMEVQIYRGYWMLTWFAKEFAGEVFDAAKIENLAVEEVLNRRLSEIPPGSDGLVLQPYWGPGLSRPLSKGSIVGFSDIHTREHLYKAIIEGIAYALKDGLETIQRRQHHMVNRIMISGGGSQSDAICQITADIFGLPVSRVQTYETTILGAAISTFNALHEFKSIEEAIAKMSHIGVTFLPDKLNFKKYDYLYTKVYLQMYPRLKQLYKTITVYRKKRI